MGVSRTPMREAIRILAKEGLVILRPSRSPVVASPTLKEATDAIEVLMALELLSGSWPASRRATPISRPSRRSRRRWRRAMTMLTSSTSSRST
ncbi:hypothetical protein ACFSZS_16925 [Seohaeicola zhoushanensis]